MTFTLSPLTADDREPVLAIFNHYVLNSFAAYPENEVPPAFYDTLLGSFRPGERRCPWLERGLYVNFEGAITACCTIKDTARFAFGRLGETPPDEVLARRAAMREELAEGRAPEACRGCTIAAYALLERVG